MERRTILAAVMIAFVVGMVAGNLTAGWTRISQISQLQAEVSLLQSQLAAAQSNATSLASEKQALLLQILQLNAQIAYLNATVASLSRGEPSILAVRFSPDGGCAAEVNYWLGRANRTVHVLIYSFTLDSIGDALLAAYGRGLDVKVVFEKQQVSQYSEYLRLSAAGVPVRNDTNPDLMHTKIAIIDGYIVLVGSFNWSAAADNDNNEVLLVIKSAALATSLEAEFQRIWTTGR